MKRNESQLKANQETKKVQGGKAVAGSSDGQTDYVPVATLKRTAESLTDKTESLAARMGAENDGNENTRSGDNYHVPSPGSYPDSVLLSGSDNPEQTDVRTLKEGFNDADVADPLTASKVEQHGRNDASARCVNLTMFVTPETDLSALVTRCATQLDYERPTCVDNPRLFLTGVVFYFLHTRLKYSATYFIMTTQINKSLNKTLATYMKLSTFSHSQRCLQHYCCS
jgi:hypothetical protein